MDQGCVYFDNIKRPAGRGYAYVAVSRFRTRGGCHLYGKLRRSDFLPVGEEGEDEDVERGYDSKNSSDSEYNGERDYEKLRMQPQDGDSGSEYDSDDEREYRG